MAAPCDNLCITGLPVGMDEATAKGVFSAYGDITSVKIVSQHRLAYIKFATVDEAKWIQENLNGNMPEGLTEPIEVKFAPEKAKGKDGGKAGKDSWGGKGDWSSGFGKSGKGDKGESWGGKGDSWGPYGKGGKDSSGKDFGGMDKGKGDAKGKGKGKGKVGIRTLFAGLCSAGALPGGEGYENDENTLFVGGLPSDTSDIDLYKIFSPFGAIAPKGIRAMVFPDTGNCKGTGFVNFMDATAAQSAIEALNGTTMGDESATLVVSIKRQGGGGDDGGKSNAKGKDGKGKWK